MSGTLKDLVQAIKQHHGTKIVAFISIPLAPSIVNGGVSQLPAPFKEIFQPLAEVSQPGDLSAESVHKAIVQSLNVVLRWLADDYEGLWQLEILKKECQLLYTFSTQSTALLEDAARHLSKVFTTCITDKQPLAVSKKWASIGVVKYLFKIYFKLNNTRLCLNVLRAIENPAAEFPPLENFDVCDVIAYFYYRSRLHFYDGEFAEALPLLEKAFVLIPENEAPYDPAIFKNKRLILVYLIVAKILVQQSYPNERLLQKYKLLHVYGPFIQSIKDGNIIRYNSCLQRHMEFFMQSEIFLIAEVQMKTLIYRNFFRLIYHVCQSLPGAIEGRLSIETVVQAFALLNASSKDTIVDRDAEWNADHIECIAANLIRSGWLKGYISHVKQMMVLSKKNPFPKI